MMKSVFGVLAALAMVSGSVVACSSSTESSGGTVTDAGKDTGKPVDSGKDTGTPKPVDGGPTDSGVCENKTTGKACTDDATCDTPCETGAAFCSPTGFTSGSLYPTPTCFSADCDPGDGTKIVGCDGDTGVCLSTGSGGICLPACSFDDSATAPTGCIGKNKCNPYGWGTDSTTMKTVGVGYCFGGCTADADCPAGNKCQKEDGLCIKAPVTYTKTPGTACTDADAKAPAKCNCLYTTAAKAGYCANSCYFGETTCDAGFACDTNLPKTKIMPDDVVFTSAPKGMAGYCLKKCTTDADCTGLNAYCDESAGMAGQKTCQIGKRRCAKDGDCPSPQKCTGATATASGTCG